MKIARVVSARFSRALYSTLINHLFIRFIRVIRGLIIPCRERGDDLLEVSNEPRIKRIARIKQGSGMKITRIVFASFSRAQYSTLINHLFIRFIRVIRGSIVFRR